MKDDIALLTTSNTLLPESQATGLIAFVNLRSASGLTIKTAGYPGDNVSRNIPNNSGQPGRDLVLSPGDGTVSTDVSSSGIIIRVLDRRRFFYSPNVDTANGQSGSGVWHSLDGDSPRVLGIHTAGPSSFRPLPPPPEDRNSGVLITKDIYDFIINQIGNDSNFANADTLPENAIIGTDPFAFLDGNDNIEGTYRRERILGNGGNDTIKGGDADDRIDGGDGEDTAVFSDNLENYTISSSGQDIIVTDNSGAEGTDTLRNIELGEFNGALTNFPDGSFNTNTTDILSRFSQPIGSLSLAAPVHVSDGDAEYTVTLAATKPDIQYNIAYIIDVSASMTPGELQATNR